MKTTPAHRSKKKTLLSDLYVHLEPVSIDEVRFERILKFGAYCLLRSTLKVQLL